MNRIQHSSLLITTYFTAGFKNILQIEKNTVAVLPETYRFLKITQFEANMK
jgi:hypothetical protein